MCITNPLCIIVCSPSEPCSCVVNSNSIYHMTNVPETTTTVITQIADRERAAHLGASMQPAIAGFSISADSLPYEKLGGAGFERLCYLLLLTRGHTPLYFVTSGQA